MLTLNFMTSSMTSKSGLVPEDYNEIIARDNASDPVQKSLEFDSLELAKNAMRDNLEWVGFKCIKHTTGYIHTVNWLQITEEDENGFSFSVDGALPSGL